MIGLVKCLWVFLDHAKFLKLSLPVLRAKNNHISIQNLVFNFCYSKTVELNVVLKHVLIGCCAKLF